MSDVANNVETIEFSKAELAVLQERMKAYRQTVDSVNEWIGFLTKQHNVSEADGWQLGDTGFVRQVEERAPQPWAEPVVVKPETVEPTGYAPVMASNGERVR
jgi:hypothetical protein